MKRYEVTVNGQVYEVSLRELADGETVEVSQPAAPATEKEMNANAAGGGIQVKTPMSGTVLSIFATEGKAVKKGEAVLVLEAMKMENEIVASSAGTITAIHVGPGQVVNPGDGLITIG
ncbi:TPA: acetyl-CoA carboxylase biotin carboxyl carrier protein subunit [Streptococcus pyogenes]|uniref:biotin/lipoyl-containing protein n=1 Tax=Streptococcus pyogenes TaxID=1314 RepID=UPI0007B6A798|nr:biotin/lipoyl-containing protein [Streptococcus pyogenes]ANC23974.1 biotin carboxyl carrier protein of oxaloacetate decarboxylase [Streptococcus pyogenes]SQF55754.1 methylmalonyl-CoA decarboxylase gamma chain [Streptococcus pyogenes]HEP1251775.1 acetyl-CoA carboxylase biotin carboxyl carrier protein subunit [Streptococcus pyogenes]HEQ4906137.1 acetyl-CoA carboxylase biotin carboxyl carrier protein subunit [Streptococcus pyogenes]HEQ4910766.1 acetyl-CoA carboxylase biotin carboxyl carrier pr